jgi:hypothetical protein
VYENYQQIQFRPDQFHSYLVSPEVGFVNHKYIGIPQNKSKGQQCCCRPVEVEMSSVFASHTGFRRPLHMYFKAESVGVASHAQLTADSGSSSPCEETRRLKSVVRVVSMEEPKSAEFKEVEPVAGGAAAVEDMETVGGGGGDGEGDGVKGESGEP